MKMTKKLRNSVLLRLFPGAELRVPRPEMAASRGAGPRAPRLPSNTRCQNMSLCQLICAKMTTMSSLLVLGRLTPMPNHMKKIWGSDCQCLDFTYTHALLEVFPGQKSSLILVRARQWKNNGPTSAAPSTSTTTARNGLEFGMKKTSEAGETLRQKPTTRGRLSTLDASLRSAYRKAQSSPKDMKITK